MYLSLFKTLKSLLWLTTSNTTNLKTKNMKPTQLTLKTFVFLMVLAMKLNGQNKIQRDSIKILKAFDKTEMVDTKSDVVDSLKAVISSLSNKVENIEKNNLNSRKDDYNSKSKLIKAQLNLLRELKETTITIMGDRDVMKSNTYISQINNPTTNTLGFSFVEVVNENLESVLTEYLNNPLNGNPAVEKFKQKKNSFLSRIKSIVSLVAPIFPPLEIVNRITNKLENHVESVTSWVDGSRSSNAKNLIIENETVFKPVIIKKFTEKLKLYITFYRKLSNTNDTFLSDIETNEIKYNPLISNINDIIASIEKASDIEFNDINSLENQVDLLFESNTERKNVSFYKRVVEKEAVKMILNKLRSTINLVEYMNKFHLDYQIIVLKNYDNYLKSLDGALILPKADKVKINNIKKIIKDTRDGVEGDATKNGFVNKYAINLRSVNTYLEMLEKQLYKY